MKDNQERRFVMDEENTSRGKQNVRGRLAAKSLRNQLKASPKAEKKSKKP